MYECALLLTVEKRALQPFQLRKTRGTQHGKLTQQSFDF